MEKTDSALTAGLCSVVVISFALHAKGPRFKTEWKQLFPFEEKYEPFALSFALRTLYLYALFTERAPKDSACFQETGFRSVVVITFALTRERSPVRNWAGTISLFFTIVQLAFR